MAYVRTTRGVSGFAGVRRLGASGATAPPAATYNDTAIPVQQGQAVDTSFDVSGATDENKLPWYEQNVLFNNFGLKNWHLVAGAGLLVTLLFAAGSRR